MIKIFIVNSVNLMTANSNAEKICREGKFVILVCDANILNANFLLSGSKSWKVNLFERNENDVSCFKMLQFKIFEKFKNLQKIKKF